MSRRAIVVTALAIMVSFSLLAEVMTSLIGDIGLLDSPQFEGPQPPVRLNLGIKMVKDAYYKLRDEKSVVSAGLLRKGFNVISMEAGHLFESSGSHEYELEFLVNGRIFRKMIEIRVRLNYSAETSEVLPESRGLDREYGLSLYIDDKLIASSSRKHYEKFPFQFKMPEIPKVHVPFDPNRRDDPMANSFSILDAAGLAYKLIKELGLRDKEKQVSQDPMRLWKQRIADYIQTDSQSITQEIKAIITIRMRDS